MKSICFLVGVMLGFQVCYMMFEQRIIEPSIKRTRTITRYKNVKRGAKINHKWRR